MFSGPKKPFTAVSVQVDRMTSEQYEEEDLSGIVDLIEVIKIQASGPTEAARALRKKLKYGSTHRQIRALTILDGLIENAGTRFQKTFADEPLLERLRMMARDDMVDATVRQKCDILFRQWAVAYSSTPGLSGIASLHKTLPQTKRRPQRQTKSLRETEVDSDDAHQAVRGHTRQPSGPSVSTSSPVAKRSEPTYQSLYKMSKKDKEKSKKIKAGDITANFDLHREKPHIMSTIASSSVASTNLLNSLQLINRETTRISSDPEVGTRFEKCKALRRQVLGYIQLVENDELVGSLLNANDELVKALTAYDLMDRDLEDDSDSDAWENPNAFGKNAEGSARGQLAGLKLGGDEAPPPKPARPDVQARESSGEESDEEVEDEDNPFGDSNQVQTPAVERPGMTWKTV